MISTSLETGVAPADPVVDALRQIARWFCITVGPRGVAIYEATNTRRGLAYESEEWIGTPWPIRQAMEAEQPRVIGPFATAPLRAGGRRVGTFIALTQNGVFARRWLDETARAAEVISVILAANGSAPSSFAKYSPMWIETARSTGWR